MIPAATARAHLAEYRRLAAEGRALTMGTVQNIRAFQGVCLKQLAIRRAVRDLRAAFPRGSS